MNRRPQIYLVPFVSILLCVVELLFASYSNAQSAPPPVRAAYSDFFELARPGYADVVLFGGAFRSDKYATIQEGLQFEQSITRYVGLVGRSTGYQLFEGEGFENPLDPASGKHKSRLNFVRLLGGLDLTPYPGTHLYVLGGKDVGDSHAVSFEGDLSSWLFSYSPHPINFSSESGYDGQNHVTSNEIDLRIVLFSTRNYLALAGAGGAIYNGGFLSGGLAGEGGPAGGMYLTRLKAGMDLQAGYGSAGAYVQFTAFKLFNWSQ